MEDVGHASSSMFTLLALLATVITLASILATLLFSGISRKGSKSVPKANVLPFYGDTNRLLKDGLNMEKQRSRSLGSVYQTWFLGNKMVVVSKIDLIKWCLSKEHEYLESDWPTSVKVLLGRYGVVNVTGEPHLKLRKALNPSFRLGPVNEVVPHMAGLAVRCCDKWASQGRVKGLLAAKEYTFLVALELILGFDASLLTDATVSRCTDTFVTWINGLFSFPINLPGTAYNKGVKARATLLAVLEENLKFLRARNQRKREGKADPGSETCADQLLEVTDEEGKPLQHEVIMDMFLSMLFAGHDTGAHTIMRLFSELPRHRHVWDKLVAEQQEVVKEHGPAIDGNAVKVMPYADAVVKEVMRLHPIVGGVFRRALADFDLGGFHIPKGRKIFLSLGHSMKQDERWADQPPPLSPNCFNPDRWLTEEGQKTGSWIGFGGGPRMCLGYLLALAEIKVLLAVLARGYHFNPTDPNEPFTNYPVGGEPVSGLLMDFKKSNLVSGST